MTTPEVIYAYLHQGKWVFNLLPGKGKTKYFRDEKKVKASKREVDKAAEDLWFLSVAYKFDEIDLKRVERIKKALGVRP